MVQNTINDAQQKSEMELVIIESDAMYVDLNGRPDDGLPAWLNTKINVSGESLPFSYFANRILRGTPASVQYDNRPPSSIYKALLQWATFDKFDAGVNVLADKNLSFSHYGTIKSALDKLAMQTNTYYYIKGNAVIWSRFQVKTFLIPFMPPINVGSQAFEPSDSSSSARSSSTSLLSDYFSFLKDKLPKNLHKNIKPLKKNFNLWQDLEVTLSQIVSKQGAFHVSPTSAAVTVIDYPANMGAIESYIQKLKSELGQQVRLQVEVLEINLNDDFNYGINWQLVRNFLSSHYNMALTSSSSPSVVPGTSSFVLNAVDGPWKGTSMIINSLKKQGQVSVVTQPSIVTLNLQPAKVSINEDVSYLKSITRVVSKFSLLDDVSMELKPGLVKTGFNLEIIPRILGEDIYMEMEWRIASLDELKEFSQMNNDKKEANVKIQLPKVTTKKFTQRSIIHSSATLIVAGFKQVKNITDHHQAFDSNLLGGKQATQQNVQTIVLITPFILSQLPAQKATNDLGLQI